MADLIAIGAGGFLGATSRYLIGRFFIKARISDFPLGTFVVNMLGSFALGLLVSNPYFLYTFLGGSARVALGVGFMGSFTTYSTLMFESFMLAEKGKFILAAANFLLSLATGLLLACLAIYWL